jgi:tetratricopeptide (TPR) repeat protein
MEGSLAHTTLPSISATFRALVRRVKFSSACGLLSKRGGKMQVRLVGQLTLITALAVGCLSGGLAAMTAGESHVDPGSQIHSELAKACPSRSDLDDALGQASSLLDQARYQDVAAMLEPLAVKDCDVRVSLLLAAAFEGQGEVSKAASILQQAHSVWPSNNSIAASLAREYLASGEQDQAVKALAHFEATAKTPEQEIEMAVVVHLGAHRLLSAESLAETDYKTYPSVHSLLLLANTLQMQGRYPDVNSLLGSKRESYADRPEFFVTLAESEYDASIYAAAGKDLLRAISLDPKMYQAHY